MSKFLRNLLILLSSTSMFSAHATLERPGQTLVIGQPIRHGAPHATSWPASNAANATPSYIDEAGTLYTPFYTPFASLQTPEQGSNNNEEVAETPIPQTPTDEFTSIWPETSGSTPLQVLTPNIAPLTPICPSVSREGYAAVTGMKRRLSNDNDIHTDERDRPAQRRLLFEGIEVEDCDDESDFEMIQDVTSPDATPSIQNILSTRFVFEQALRAIAELKAAVASGLAENFDGELESNFNRVMVVCNTLISFTGGMNVETPDETDINSFYNAYLTLNACLRHITVADLIAFTDNELDDTVWQSINALQSDLKNDLREGVCLLDSQLGVENLRKAVIEASVYGGITPEFDEGLITFIRCLRSVFTEDDLNIVSANLAFKDGFSLFSTQKRLRETLTNLHSSVCRFDQIRRSKPKMFDHTHDLVLNQASNVLAVDPSETVMLATAPERKLILDAVDGMANMPAWLMTPNSYSGTVLHGFTMYTSPGLIADALSERDLLELPDGSPTKKK